MDNLMHSTLNEIAIWIRIVELPPTIDYRDMTPFYEDETIDDSTQDQDNETPGYHQGRKINYTYPSPPSTPPPVTLLAQLFSNKNVPLVVRDQQSTITPATAKTTPWAAAFMAGTQAGRVGNYQGKHLDKAQIRRLLTKGIKPHRSELPPLPIVGTRLNNHPICNEFKEAKRVHLTSYY